jgi:hypothetical protein
MHARIADDRFTNHVAHPTYLSVAVIPFVDAVSQLLHCSGSQVDDLAATLFVDERHVHDGGPTEHAKCTVDDTSLRWSDCKHGDRDAGRGGYRGESSSPYASRLASKRSLRCRDRVDDCKSFRVVSEQCNEFAV